MERTKRANASAIALPDSDRPRLGLDATTLVGLLSNKRRT
jgi:hypothetical protein